MRAASGPSVLRAERGIEPTGSRGDGRGQRVPAPTVCLQECLAHGRVVPHAQGDVMPMRLYMPTRGAAHAGSARTREGRIR